MPEKCYLFVDRCVVPGETDEICIAQIMEAAEQLGLSGKVDVRLKPRKSPYMQSFAVEEDHPLVKILQDEFYSVTGKDLPCAYDASVCDSNILAVSLGIPVVPGSDGGVPDLAAAKRVALEIGYPVIIKATAGGGGRGMKVAEDEWALRSWNDH